MAKCVICKGKFSKEYSGLMYVKNGRRICKNCLPAGQSAEAQNKHYASASASPKVSAKPAPVKDISDEKKKMMAEKMKKMREARRAKPEAKKEVKQDVQEPKESSEEELEQEMENESEAESDSEKSSDEWLI